MSMGWTTTGYNNGKGWNKYWDVSKTGGNTAYHYASTNDGKWWSITVHKYFTDTNQGEDCDYSFKSEMRWRTYSNGKWPKYHKYGPNKMGGCE
jgi:hypothetical protein